MPQSPARANQYNGKITPVGNFKGIRLDAAPFKGAARVQR